MAVGIASPTPLNILAGISGQGGTPSLAWFAPLGTTLPTDAITALPNAFLTAGYVAESGFTIATATNTTDINAYGVTVPVRTLVTSERRTAQLTMLETNPVTQAVYRRLPLPGQSGAPAVVASTGGLSFTEGQARVQSYVLVVAASDGTNIIRKVFPNVQVTDKADEAIAQSAAIQYGVTFTAYPDSNGNAIYSYYIVPNLATA